MSHRFHFMGKHRYVLVALVVFVVSSSLPLSACSSSEPISETTMREAAVEQLLNKGGLFYEMYSNVTTVNSVDARGKGEYAVSVKTSDVGSQEMQVTIIKEELFLAYEDQQFAEYIYKWYRGIRARELAGYIQAGIIKAVGGLKFRVTHSPFSTELWFIAVFHTTEESDEPAWYFYPSRSVWSSLLDAFELAYSQEKDEAFRKFADRSSVSSRSAGGSTITVPDDHGDNTEKATTLPLAHDISGILADQKDIDVFAWLASDPGAYRVKVISLDGRKIEAILSFKEVATGRLKEVKKAANSKLVDITVVANHPSIYFVQLKHADKTRVAEYSVRVDPTEDPSLPPQIITMPRNGIPGDTINIFGGGFGADSGSVQFAGSTIAPVVMWSSKQVIAKIPPGSGSIDVVVKTKGGKTSEAFRFTYGPKLGDEVIQQTRDWAKARIPEAEKRLEEAEDRMWEAYVRAEESYQQLKKTKGTELFQDINELTDELIETTSQKISSHIAEQLADLLVKEAEKRGEKGAALVAPLIAKYAFAALHYYNIGKDYYKIGEWAAMDAVLVSRNIKSQWNTWAVLSPAVKEYERAQEELDTLKTIAGIITTAQGGQDKYVWTSTENQMQEAKAGLRMVPLRDGRILLSGGSTGYQSMASAEIFDPRLGRFVRTNDMLDDRFFHTMTLLQDGRVLVTGGHSDLGRGTKSAEVYDPVTSSWISVSSMARPRSRHTATLLNDGRVFVTGGLDDNEDALNTAEIYDPTTNKWSSAASMNERRTHHTAILLEDGRVLVVGGNSAELYDAKYDRWTYVGAWKGDKYWVSHQAVLLQDGTVLALGGDDYIGTAKLYDPKSREWKWVGKMSTARSYSVTIVLKSGDVIVVGGWNETDGVLASAELYNFTTGQWTKAEAMREPRAAAAAVLMQNGAVLVAGGAKEPNNNIDILPLASAEVYGSSTWQQK